MIEMMFFYDGNLSDIKADMEDLVIIDAKEGYTANMTMLDEVYNDYKQYMILTNQIKCLNMDYVWDKVSHRPRVCFRDIADGKWKPIGRFTKKDLKYTSRLERLYIEGEFNKKAYRKVAPKKKRDYLSMHLD